MSLIRGEGIGNLDDLDDLTPTHQQDILVLPISNNVNVVERDTIEEGHSLCQGNQSIAEQS